MNAYTKWVLSEEGLGTGPPADTNCSGCLYPSLVRRFKAVTVFNMSGTTTNKHARCTLASFPGHELEPGNQATCRLDNVCIAVLQATESWAGPGNEASYKSHPDKHCNVLLTATHSDKNWWRYSYDVVYTVPQGGHRACFKCKMLWASEQPPFNRDCAMQYDDTISCTVCYWIPRPSLLDSKT